MQRARCEKVAFVLREDIDAKTGEAKLRRIERGVHQFSEILAGSAALPIQIQREMITTSGMPWDRGSNGGRNPRSHISQRRRVAESFRTCCVLAWHLFTGSAMPLFSAFLSGTQLRCSASKYDGFVGFWVTWGKYVWVEEASGVMALIAILFIGLQR